MQTRRSKLGCLALLAALSATEGATPVPAADFPLGRSYKAISISGFDVQKMGMTLAIVREGAGETLRGSGHAGCNRWNAAVTLRDDGIDFAPIATTRMACVKAKMTAESAFLSALRGASRWRLEGDRLILEGDTARLMLRAEPAGRR